MHCQSNTHTMPVIAFLSTGPFRRTVHIGGGLAYQRTREIELAIPRLGIHFGYSSQAAFEVKLGLAGRQPVDLHREVPHDLTRRALAAVGHGPDVFALIQLEHEEAERLARAIAREAPNGACVPVIDVYAPHNGAFVPVELIRKRLAELAAPTEKGPTMPHPLQRSAPSAYNLLKQIVDDSSKVIDEFVLYRLARAQHLCTRIEHIKGDKPPRATTLTDAEIDAAAKAYAVEIAPRKVSQIHEPRTDPLPDGTVAIVPLLGQADGTNVVLLGCFIAHGTPGAMRLALDIDEVLPRISQAVLEGLGRTVQAAAE